MSGPARKTPRYNQEFFREWRGLGPLAVGLIAIALIAAFLFYAFTKWIPFTDPGYEVRATFANAVDISDKSPIRIAGINVGRVVEVEPKGDATVVTFTVEEEGRPIRTDAAAQIARGLGVKAAVLPMCDEPVRTRILSEGAWRGLQEYLILDGGRPAVEGIELEGIASSGRRSRNTARARKNSGGAAPSWRECRILSKRKRARGRHAPRRAWLTTSRPRSDRRR